MVLKTPPVKERTLNVNLYNSLETQSKHAIMIRAACVRVLALKFIRCRNSADSFAYYSVNNHAVVFPKNTFMARFGFCFSPGVYQSVKLVLGNLFT